MDVLLVFMTKTNNNARIQTLKRMLSVAKKLVENESNEIFELAHHIADNVLSKVCMLVGIEKNRKDLVYEHPYGRKKTKDFDVLYRTILEKYYPNVPIYNDIIRQYHRNRNTYNHDIVSLDFSIRKPLAINYINCVEDILREVGYLGMNEQIESSHLISNALLTDLNFSSKEQLTQKFEKLFDRLASKDPENVIVHVKSLVEDIGETELGKVLKMEYTKESDERTMLKEHQKWNLSIRRGSSRHLRLMKYINGDSQTYDFKIPDQNVNILNEYLDLLKNRFKEYFKKN